MESKYFILDNEDKVLVEAFLELTDYDKVVLSVEPPEDAERLESMNIIRYREARTYGEKYEGIVYKIRRNKIFLKDVKNITAEQRQEVKVNFSYDTTITALKDDIIVNTPVKVRDISCGGFCFDTKADLPKLKLFETIISFTNEPLILNFKLVRKVKDEKSDMFNYGGQFVGLRGDEERILREGIYQLEKATRKKSRKVVVHDFD